MIRLLNIEFLKILNYKTARNFIIAYFVLLGLAAVGLSQNISILGLNLNLGEMGIFDFPDVWHFITYFASIAKIFLAIIFITSVTNEYSFGTLKQNLIDGLTKKEFILSKTLTNVLFSIIATIFVAIISLILGLIYTEGDYSILSESIYIPAYFLKHIAFFSFCMFLGLLVRKSAFAFALLFVWFIIEGVFSGAEYYIRKQFFGHDLESTDTTWLFNFLPLNSMSNLIPSPLKRIEMLDAATHGQMASITVQPVYIVMGIFYFLLFTFLSYRLIKKRDL